MCSRYEVNNSVDEVVLRFDLAAPPEFMPAPEVRPTNRVPVIEAGGKANLLRWGLEVSWDKKPLINARSETLAEKRTFKPLLENRCLVPASAYFEWRQEDGRKIKTRLHRPDGEMFAMAGLMEDDRFTVITCTPSPAIAFIHGRMPAILDRERERDWLSPDAEFADVAHLLQPYPDDGLDWEDAPVPRKQGDLFS